MTTAALGNPVVPDVYMYNKLSTITLNHIGKHLHNHGSTGANH